jgi:hypothetical protein
MTKHNHNAIHGVITVELKKEIDDFLTSTIREFEIRICALSEMISENARNVPENWDECPDCEDRVLDSIDSAMGYLIREFRARFNKEFGDF